ncbi:MAG: hypothetical protein LBR67_04055, partial [Dysgonamonadaceae bacterium]|nr:hypothetical protein [Dysgonamonadaceae bacterium]
YKVDTSGATALETEITNLFVRDGYSEITAFKFTYPNTNGSAVYKVGDSVEKGLVVATYNASKAKEECGKLEVFTLLDANSGTLELAKYPTDNMIAAEPVLAPKQVTMSFTGLGKVVGLDFKKK